MKNLLVLLLAVASTAATSSAQMFRPRVVEYAATGAIAGAVIGHQSRETANGALVGAGIGALLAVASEDRAEPRYYPRRHLPPPDYRSYDYCEPDVRYVRPYRYERPDYYRPVRSVRRVIIIERPYDYRRGRWCR